MISLLLLVYLHHLIELALGRLPKMLGERRIPSRRVAFGFQEQKAMLKHIGTIGCVGDVHHGSLIELGIIGDPLGLLGREHRFRQRLEEIHHIVWATLVLHPDVLARRHAREQLGARAFDDLALDHIGLFR